MDSFYIMRAPKFSDRFNYIRTLFAELGVVSYVETYVYDTEDEGCTHRVHMESWTKEGLRVRGEIEKGEYIFGTNPPYLILEPVT